MSIWAIVPVKPLNRAKSRLSGVLSQSQRTALAETMLKQVLATLSAVPRISGTLVISRDTKALAIAREYQARTVQESHQTDLNLALMRATEVVRVWNALAILVLPADLPFVTSEDVTALLDLGQNDPGIVIATDRVQDGTNALLMRPPGLIPFSYGIGSYTRHIEDAIEAGATLKTFASPGLSLDIDIPEDLEEYNRILRGEEHEILRTFLPDIMT